MFLSGGKELPLAICFSTAQKYTEITSYGMKVNEHKEEDTSLHVYSILLHWWQEKSNL